jgi:hypothetical protein
LNTYGEWESEPLPSNRDDEFKARSRLSLDDAWKIAREYLCHASPEQADGSVSPDSIRKLLEQAIEILELYFDGDAREGDRKTSLFLGRLKGEQQGTGEA